MASICTIVSPLFSQCQCQPRLNASALHAPASYSHRFTLVGFLVHYITSCVLRLGDKLCVVSCALGPCPRPWHEQVMLLVFGVLNK